MNETYLPFLGLLFFFHTFLLVLFVFAFLCACLFARFLLIYYLVCITRCCCFALLLCSSFVRFLLTLSLVVCLLRTFPHFGSLLAFCSPLACYLLAILCHRTLLLYLHISLVCSSVCFCLSDCLILLVLGGCLIIC